MRSYLPLHRFETLNAAPVIQEPLVYGIALYPSPRVSRFGWHIYAARWSILAVLAIGLVRDHGSNQREFSANASIKRRERQARA